MVKKYGQPDEMTASMLVWENNDPWRRTIVYKQEIDHDFPMPHKDVLEQFIPYGPDPQLFDELAQFDGSVIAERTKGELSARCDSEHANFLAINLANQILQGEMSVEQARQAYGEAMKAVKAGNPPKNTTQFTFSIPRDYTGDPDETTIKQGQQAWAGSLRAQEPANHAQGSNLLRRQEASFTPAVTNTGLAGFWSQPIGFR